MTGRTYILILMLLVFFRLFSQEKKSNPPIRFSPDFLHFSIENGLPSSETYFVHQDRKGYIWICTDRGVARYDGFNFRFFTTADGLVDNVVFEIYEDHRGRLWFLSIRRGLCYFENGKIVRYKFNDKIRKLLGNNMPIDKDLYIDSRDNLYYGLVNWGSLKITADGKISEREQPVQSVRIDSLGGIPFLSIKRDHHSQNGLKVYINGQFKKTLTNEFANPNISKNEKGPRYFLISNQLLSLEDASLFKTKNIRTIALYAEENLLWTGNLRDGVVIYDLNQKDKGGNPDIRMNFLKNRSISHIMKDRDGGYWFSSLEDGVFYCRDIHFLNSDSERGLLEDNVITLTDVRTNILLGYFGSSWETLFAPRIRESHGFSNPARFYYMSASDLSVLLVTRDSIFGTKKTYGDLQVLEGPGANRAYYNKKLDRLIFGSNFIYEIAKGPGGVYENKNLAYDLFNDYARDLLIEALLLNDRSEIYFGTVNGLYRLENSKIVKMQRKTGNQLFGLRITDLRYSSHWHNVAGTRGNGLFSWEGDRILLHINARNGLLSDDVNKLYVDERDRLWVCTNQGINILEKINNKLKIHRVTEENGLISNEVNDIVVRGNSIWAATKKGISAFNWNDVLRKNNPSIFLSEVRLDERIVPGATSCSFVSGQNVQLTLGSTNFSKIGNHLFRFRLSGSDWQQSASNTITINRISAGNYRLEVQEMQTDGGWSKSWFLYRFEVRDPFYLQWYSLLIYGILFLLLFYLFYRYRVRQLNQRHFRQNHLLQLERRALQAQMNPHFIFNSLNSIQSFLVFNETEKAEKYLLKFSHLVRRILNNSVTEEIPIRDEIQTLREYLDLEKMRFRQRFDYEIREFLPENDQDRLIPGMLIQPFVENAVIHGFKGFESGGKIVLSFRMLNDATLLCEISDNGVGFDPDNVRKPGTHVSHGIRITRERLRTYSRDGKTYYVKFEAKPGATGTRVELTLPVHA